MTNDDGQRRGPGRPSNTPDHVPTDRTRKQVETLTGFGIPQVDIARLMEISDRTLRTHYRTELDLGEVKANTEVAQRLFLIATKGQGREALAACIFWLKTRAGWREVARVLDDEAPERNLGKKEVQYRQAATAGQDTGWGDDLRFDGDTLPN